MRRVQVLSSLVVAALALAGCAGSSAFCDDQQAELASLAGTKLAACPLLKASVDAQPMLSGDACVAAYDKCSADDQQKLEGSLTCIGALGTCEAASDTLTSAYSLAMMSCSKTGICATSATCIAAFNFAQICALIP